jgi:hypothetical protein
MLSGSWMSLSSTRVTSTPQSSVATSRIVLMSTLMRSVSASASSRVLTDDLTQGGLGDLIDRRADVLDRDDRLHRVDVDHASGRSRVHQIVGPRPVRARSLRLDRRRCVGPRIGCQGFEVDAEGSQ